MNRHRAFTLTELLIVVGVIALLAALVATALPRAKGGAQATVCMNHLLETGLALQMYVSDHNIYPSVLGGGGPPFKTWAGQLAPYNPLNWTNLSSHCPAYLAEGGNVIWQPPPSDGGPFEASSSYAYNARGMSLYGLIGSTNLFREGQWLGLDELRLTVPGNRVVAPGEMYAVADTRPFQLLGQSGFNGPPEMRPWQWPPSILHAKVTEAPPPHSDGYNLLFADTHVDLVKRRDYLYPPRAAQNWNRDNQPHPELWSPTSEWVVQN